MKIAEDLEQILVVLHTLLVIIEMTPLLNKQSHTLLVIIEMTPLLNKQSGSDLTGRI